MVVTLGYITSCLKINIFRIESFSYHLSLQISGYVTTVLDDAEAYANHAKKKSIDLDDVKLAVSMQMEQSFTTPPPREVINIT